MPATIDRIKKLVENNLIQDAIELPSLHKNKKSLTTELEEVLSQFDDDVNYAHFLVRVKRSENPIFVSTQICSSENQKQEAIGNDSDFSIDKLVNETFDLTKNLEKKRSSNSNQSSENYSPEYLFQNAKTLEKHGDYDIARKMYKYILSKNALIPESLAGIARTYEKQGLYTEALNYYEEAIAFCPEPEYYQSLAAMMIKTGRDQDAVEVLTRALTIPNLNDQIKFEFHKSLGNCFTRLGNHQKAEEHYFSAYEINSDSDSLQVNVGTLALNKNDYSTAKTHFNRALELNSKNDKALCGLGIIELHTGNTQKAYDLFTQATEINPNNINAIYNLVKCAYELKSFDTASKVLGQYLASCKEQNPNILYSFAGILYHQNRLQSAADVVHQILKINPNHDGAKELKELIDMKMNQ